jgi:hypothetical protein
MSEFDFLKKMFFRLSEMRSFERRSRDKNRNEEAGAFECAALSIECSIRDYLSLKGQSCK